MLEENVNLNRIYQFLSMLHVNAYQIEHALRTDSIL